MKAPERSAALLTVFKVGNWRLVEPSRQAIQRVTDNDMTQHVVRPGTNYSFLNCRWLIRTIAEEQFT